MGAFKNSRRCRYVLFFSHYSVSLLFATLLLGLTVTPTSHAEIYTERGTRYYRAFGADFVLRDGRIDDDQALKLLRLVEASYERGRTELDTWDIWDNLDDIYDGGAYHGEILLTIFRTCLNEAYRL